MKEYEQKKQYFMNEPVIIIETFIEGIPDVQNRWIPIQHFFKCLNRLTSNGQVQTPDRNTLIEFITQDLNMEFASKTFTIENGTGSGSVQDMNCIRLDVLALVVTQFKPSKRKGNAALLIWRTYMQWLNNLLSQVNAVELLVRDEKIATQGQYINSINKRTVKGNTLNDVVCATGTTRAIIEDFCYKQGWYERKNGHVNIIKDEFVVALRKNALGFTELGMDILLTQFADKNRRAF